VADQQEKKQLNLSVHITRPLRAKEGKSYNARRQAPNAALDHPKKVFFFIRDRIFQA
jgi:hypothetical protein